MLGNEQSSPMNWPLVSVMEVFPGKDEIVRVVRIRTPTTTFL